MQETYRKKWVPSLFSKSVDCIIAYLPLYKGILKYLPVSAKERMLRKILLEGMSWEDFTSNEILSNLIHPSLKSINFHSVRVNDDTLDIIKLCTRLTEIRLRNFGNLDITSQALKRLFEQTKELIVLDIAHCKEFNDDVLKHISLCCPKARELCVEGCDLTDDGLVTLTENNKELKRMTISKTNITGNGIQAAVSRKNCHFLQELRLDNCLDVNDDVLKAVIHYCPEIEILTFYNCAVNVQTSIFQDISVKCKNLKQLHWTFTW